MQLGVRQEGCGHGGGVREGDRSESEPASDSDPVVDSINEATADIEQPTPQTATSTRSTRAAGEQVENRTTTEDEDEEDDEDVTVPDVNYAEIGSQPTVEADDSADDKPAAKKTAGQEVLTMGSRQCSV